MWSPDFFLLIREGQTFNEEVTPKCLDLHYVMRDFSYTTVRVVRKHPSWDCSPFRKVLLERVRWEESKGKIPWNMQDCYENHSQACKPKPSSIHCEVEVRKASPRADSKLRNLNCGMLHDST
jgi:hypothetical protein